MVHLIIYYTHTKTLLHVNTFLLSFHIFVKAVFINLQQTHLANSEICSISFKNVVYLCYLARNCFLCNMSCNDLRDLFEHSVVTSRQVARTIA